MVLDLLQDHSQFLSVAVLPVPLTLTLPCQSFLEIDTVLSHMVFFLFESCGSFYHLCAASLDFLVFFHFRASSSSARLVLLSDTL